MIGWAVAVGVGGCAKMALGGNCLAQKPCIRVKHCEIRVYEYSAGQVDLADLAGFAAICA